MEQFKGLQVDVVGLWEPMQTQGEHANSILCVTRWITLFTHKGMLHHFQIYPKVHGDSASGPCHPVLSEEVV